MIWQLIRLGKSWREEGERKMLGMTQISSCTRIWSGATKWDRIQARKGVPRVIKLSVKVWIRNENQNPWLQVLLYYSMLSAFLRVFPRAFHADKHKIVKGEEKKKKRQEEFSNHGFQSLTEMGGEGQLTFHWGQFNWPSMILSPVRVVLFPKKAALSPFYRWEN